MPKTPKPNRIICPTDRKGWDCLPGVLTMPHSTFVKVGSLIDYTNLEKPPEEKLVQYFADLSYDDPLLAAWISEYLFDFISTLSPPKFLLDAPPFKRKGIPSTMRLRATKMFALYALLYGYGARPLKLLSVMTIGNLAKEDPVAYNRAVHYLEYCLRSYGNLKDSTDKITVDTVLDVDLQLFHEDLLKFVKNGEMYSQKFLHNKLAPPKS